MNREIKQQRLAGDARSHVRGETVVKFRHGFTLVELVLVLIILAILASAALNMVDIQVDQVRFEQTQQTMNAIEHAVLGAENSRAPDGSRMVSGFVADCGRLPYSLEELYLHPTALVPVFTSAAPAGDVDVTVTGGWNGPYLQLAIGGTSLPDGWASGFEAYKSDGTVSATTEPIAILRSLGRDQATGGTAYDADLSMVFQADAAVPGLVTQAENRWSKTVVAYLYYNDASTNPDPANGKKIVVRVYGPVVDPSTGVVTLGTIAQAITTLSLSDGPTPVSISLPNLSVGPRIIRAYQLNTDSDPTSTAELSADTDLAAVSVPTRLVVSRENSSVQLILRND